MLDAIDADAARILHLTQAAQTILNELPFTDATGKRIPSMDQLWAVLSSMEMQAQLLCDSLEDVNWTVKQSAAA